MLWSRNWPQTRKVAKRKTTGFRYGKRKTDISSWMMCWNCKISPILDIFIVDIDDFLEIFLRLILNFENCISLWFIVSFLSLFLRKTHQRSESKWNPLRDTGSLTYYDQLRILTFCFITMIKKTLITPAFKSKCVNLIRQFSFFQRKRLRLPFRSGKYQHIFRFLFLFTGYIS